MEKVNAMTMNENSRQRSCVNTDEINGCEKCRDAHLHAATMIDNRCPSCRARMLAVLPSRESRAGWIRRWREQGESAMADKVLTLLREMQATKQGEDGAGRP